jgi:hypothetical protein
VAHNGFSEKYNPIQRLLMTKKEAKKLSRRGFALSVADDLFLCNGLIRRRKLPEYK